MAKVVAALFALLNILADASAASKQQFLRTMRGRSLAVSGLPDPKCHSGVLGLNGACCAGYCGECSDYETCSSVRGQDSEGACCASKVLELKCGSGAPANICLKSCSDSLPPCIMDEEAAPAATPIRTAGTDCN